MMIEWLRNLPGRSQSRRKAPRIVAITSENMGEVKLGWYADLTMRQLDQHVAAYPGLAFMVEGGEAYVIGGHWRRRKEIGSVIAMSPRSHGPALLRRLVSAYRDRHASLVVADYQMQQNLDLLCDEGFKVIETIVRYERDDCEVISPTVTVDLQPYGPKDQSDVLQIERESFPWLWWNSAEELNWYSRLPGVELWLALSEGEPIGYSGFTINGREGHLDRVAVRRGWQGRGYGEALVVRALQRMSHLGARRVALSTQSDNLVSQSLYRKLGFHKARWSYDIHGLWLDGSNGAS